MGWLVVYCTGRGEHLAWSQIKAAGYECYLPLFKRRLHRKGKSHTYSALFPRYLFVRTHVLWKIIYTFRGVSGFLTNDDMPVVVQDQVIEEIRKRQLAGEFDEKPAPKRQRKQARSFKELKKLLNDTVDNAEAA